MCGRYTHTGDPVRSARQLKAENQIQNWRPRYNIAPTQSAPVVLLEGGRVLRSLLWGLRHNQAFSASGLLINARSESVATKPRFKNLLLQQRCLVPADGFFEWQWSGRRRSPVRFTLRDGPLFYMAGLWDWQAEPGAAAPVRAFVILTTEANDLVARVHDRMPVIVPEERCAEWLEDAPVKGWDSFWRPFPAERMDAYLAHAVVNSPTTDAPECIQSLGPLPEVNPAGEQTEFGF
jgi:putative SOS response-associated peptidase YedK